MSTDLKKGLLSSGHIALVEARLDGSAHQDRLPVKVFS